jgi:SnoaL-like protein
MRMEISDIKPPNPDSEATPEETLRLVRDLLEAWNVHDVKRLKTFYVPAYEGVDVGQAQPQSGPQGVTRLVKRYLQAYPDLRFVDKDVVVQGNRAVLVWKAHGTYGGTDTYLTDGARHRGARHLLAHNRERQGHPWAIYLGRGRAPAKHRPVARTLERRKENTDGHQNSR